MLKSGICTATVWPQNEALLSKVATFEKAVTIFSPIMTGSSVCSTRKKESRHTRI